MALVAGETAHVDLRLVKHAVVAGRVVNEGGKPLACLHGGAIAADRPALHYRSSITDAQLEDRSEPLPAGACTILVTGGELRAQSASVEVVAKIESEVEIRIEGVTPRGFRLKWDSEHTPKEVFGCSGTDAAGQLVQRLQLPPPTDGINHAGVQGLVVGSYWIDVRTADGRSSRVAFDVSDLAVTNEWIDIPMR